MDARPMSENALPALISLEAEQTLVGLLIRWPETFPEIAVRLKPEHFGDQVTAEFYRRAAAEVETNGRPNLATMKGYYAAVPEHGEKLARYLVSLVDAAVGLPEDAFRYADQIRDFALRRRLDEAASEMKRRVRDLDASPESTLAEISHTLQTAATEGASTSLTRHQVIERVVGRISKPLPCYSTGLPSLDESMGGGLFAERLYAIQARMKVGKSALLGTISHNLNRAGVKHLFVAQEMTPEEVELRNAARELRVNPVVFLRPDADRWASKIAASCLSLPNATIYERSAGKGFDELRQMVASAIVRHGITGIVIDYLQRIKGQQKGQNEEQHLRAVCDWLSDNGRRTGLWTLIAAQENQEGSTRGGEGLLLACDQYYVLNREKGSNTAWLEARESRYVAARNVGSQDIPGLILNTSGPWFEDAALPAHPGPQASSRTA